MPTWRFAWVAAALLERFAHSHTLSRFMRAEVGQQPFEPPDLQDHTVRDLHVHPDDAVNQISDQGFSRADGAGREDTRAKHGEDQTGIRARVGDAPEECAIPVGMRKETVMDGLFQIVLYDTMDKVSETIKATHKYQYGSADEVVEKVGEILPSNGTLVDVGANIGYHTLLFAARGYHVLAVEPMHRNVEALKASLCLNPALAPRVRILRAALLAPGHTGLQCVVRSSTYHPHGEGGRSYSDGNGELKCGSSGQLHRCEQGEMNCDEPPVATLDQVLQEAALESVDFLRIEVGGFECEVLDGGKTLWTRYNPKFLLVEKRTESSFRCVNEASTQHDLQLLDMHQTALLFRMG